MWKAEKGKIKHPGYTGRIFEPDRFQKLVDRAVEALESIMAATPFDAIAGSGNSGALLCAALSYKTGIPVITIRKDGEVSASGNMATGHVINTRYLIVDDVISGGRCIRRCIREISRREQECISYARVEHGGPWEPMMALSRPVGVLLYAEEFTRNFYKPYYNEYNASEFAQEAREQDLDVHFTLPVHNVFEYDSRKLNITTRNTP